MELLPDPNSTSWPFPFMAHRTGSRPLLPSKPICTPRVMRWPSSKSGLRAWKLDSIKIPPRHPDRRHRIHLTRKLITAPDHKDHEKAVASPVLRGIAQCYLERVAA